MLTLPAFEHHAPRTLEEAVALLSRFPDQVKVLAGGTDLIPNMKHRLFTPAHLVSLSAIAGLNRIRLEGDLLTIGAMCTLAQIASDVSVRRHLPSLAKAASQVAGPQLREMGTLGGNLCLDTRCVYYNQTYFWRKALGFCLKKDGTVCHVVQGGNRCVAAASNDTAPVLMTLDAVIRIIGPNGSRDIPILELYTPDGIRNTVLQSNELVVEARVKLPQGRVLAGYEKLRVRGSIDYPALTIAAAAEVTEQDRISWVRVVVSSLAARPHFLRRLESFRGRVLDASVIQTIAETAYKQCHPLTNINVDSAWRREMVPVYVRRCFQNAESRAFTSASESHPHR
jgi:4-hydroxybenzoyl-CoA reductase subunit beta